MGNIKLTALRPSGEVVLMCGREEGPGEGVGVREGEGEACRDNPPSLCSLRRLI